MRRLYGFSFVEVIVVVLILSIIAALLFPVFARSKESGRQASCISNLRQLGAAMNLYVADYDGVEIARSRVNSYTIKPYLNNNEVLFCPDFPKALRGNLASSYMWRFVKPTGKNPNYLEFEERMKQLDAEREAEYLRLGGDYALLICFVHDELYYQASEPMSDPSASDSFVIELRVNGSIYRGRMPYPRSILLREMMKRNDTRQ